MKLYSAKLVSTTNSKFKNYCELDGVLMVPPLGLSPRFKPDSIRFEILTMSMLNEIDEHTEYTSGGSGVLILELKTKNSLYVFEVKEDYES